MGCGSSLMASSMASPDKSPDDLYIPPMRLATCHIESYDAWFQAFEEPVNIIIACNNDIVEALLDVLTSVGVLLGALKVEFSICTDHDVPLLEFALTDGSMPSAKEVEELLSTPEVQDADKRLAAALSTLLVTLPIGLNANSDGLSGQAEFNAALKDLRVAVGANYSINVIVRPAAHPGGPTAFPTISRPVLADDVDVELPTFREASLLDIARLENAPELFAAHKTAIDQAHALAKSARNLSITLELRHGRLLAPQGIEDAARSASIAKNVRIFNNQAFKLAHAATHANTRATLTSAVMMVVTALREKAERMAAGAEKDTKATIPTITPTLEVAEDGSCKLGMDILCCDGAVDLTNFPDCLPAQARQVWLNIKALEAKVSEVTARLGPLEGAMTQLIVDSKELNVRAADAVSSTDLDLAAQVKAGRHIRENMVAIADATAVFATVNGIAKKVVAELQTGVVQAQHLLPGGCDGNVAAGTMASAAVLAVAAGAAAMVAEANDVGAGAAFGS